VGKENNGESKVREQKVHHFPPIPLEFFFAFEGKSHAYFTFSFSMFSSVWSNHQKLANLTYAQGYFY
jgi:hypothetical protein